MHRIFLLFIGVLIGLINIKSVCAATGDDDALLPLLHSIDGDRVVVLVTPQGNREIEAGARVNIGNRIRTGPRASAKIVFSDGTKLLIGKLTELEVQKPVQESIPSGFLLQGQIRGVVLKSKQSLDRPKFMLRSKSAVMGVRGTDFVFEAKPGGVETGLHTLEGTVEVGQTDAEVIEGKGVKVHTNHAVTADSQGVGEPQRFNRQDFLADVTRDQPFFLSAGQSDRSLLIQRDAYEPPPPVVPPRFPSAFQRNQIQLGLVSTQYKHQTPQNSCPTCEGDIVNDWGARLSWHPTLHLLNGWFALRSTIGISFIHPGSGKTRTLHTMVGLAATIEKINPIIIEVGPMLEQWRGENNFIAMGPSVLLGLKLSDDSLIERVFVSISESEKTVQRAKKTCKQGTKLVDCSEFETHRGSQIVAGVGFNL